MTVQRTPTDFRRVVIWFSDRNFLTPMNAGRSPDLDAPALREEPG
jgi:hypothetical protein